MSRRESDVARVLAARAHKESAPVAKRVAKRLGCDTRTVQRWGSAREAKGSPVERFGRYMNALDKPWRMEAHMEAVRLMATVRGWSREKLIAEYRSVRLRDKDAEATNTKNDLAAEAHWLDCSAASERDAANDLLKACCERRFAELGMGRAEVLP